MAKKRLPRFWGQCLVWIFSGLITVLIIWGFHTAIRGHYTTHFLPHTSIADLDISGLTPYQAHVLTSARYRFPPDSTLTISTPTQAFATSSASLGFSYQIDEFLTAILHSQQSSSWWDWWENLILGARYPYPSVYLTHDDEALQLFLTSIDQQITTPGRHPAITLSDDKKVTIDPGQKQISLDLPATFTAIQDHFPQSASIAAVLKISPDFTPLTPEQQATIAHQATLLTDKSLRLTTDEIIGYEHFLNTKDLLPLLLPDSPARQQTWKDLFTALSAEVSRPAQEPLLTVDTVTMRATTFIPPLDGLTLDENQLVVQINHALESLQTADTNVLDLTLPIHTTPPTHTLSQVNSYGINEVIGFGESYYDHSSAGRIHNVATAAKNINGVLVAPGEEFSFNQAVGEVSAATGYQEGYIIQDGRSVLSAGGGVCQVSTTVFRALLDSGLQITLRRPHSYRVTYYELSNDPGFDATVYTGNVDLRFINDTDHHVMITTHTDSQKLHMYVQIWGTSDGRTTAITDYKKYNAVGAPPPQYIPDPSLPPGKVKQIDWAIGGLDTVFTHTIYNADGSVRSTKKYPSHYQAWSAKYLVGPTP